MRLLPVIRGFLRFLIVLLQALLLNWAAGAPICWILRDGLGPDSVESGWAMGIYKTLVVWGIPALALGVPLFGLTRLERRMAEWGERNGSRIE